MMLKMMIGKLHVEDTASKSKYDVDDTEDGKKEEGGDIDEERGDLDVKRESVLSRVIKSVFCLM